MPLELPVIVSVNVHAATDEVARSAKVEEALPPAGGVTLVGENVAVTPSGRPEMLRLVAALNPFTLPTVTVAEPVLLGVRVRAGGTTFNVKSWDCGVTLSGGTSVKIPAPKKNAA